MRDYEVTVLYQDRNNDTQQELFIIGARSEDAALNYVKNTLADEGSVITYIKIKEA